MAQSYCYCRSARWLRSTKLINVGPG